MTPPTLTPAPPVSLGSRTRGRVVTSRDADWDDVRGVFNLTTDVRPDAIALPLDAADVREAVAYARASGLRVAAQSTGHNAAAHGDLEGTLLVDVRELGEIEIDPARRRVRVGAGVRWQQVVPRLSELGLAALHGSSPLVGVAGYSLGGGMGWLARKHGLQTNSVTAIEVVGAGGEELRVDAEHHPDLFWALRGGNGNFGVVTALEFEVYPVPELYAGAMFFPMERAGEVLDAWTEVTPEAPEELMTWTTLLRFPEDPALPAEIRGGEFAVFMGAHLGEEDEGRSLLRPVRELGPAMDSFGMVPPVELSDLAMDPPEPLPVAMNTALLRDLPPAAIEGLVEAVGAGSGTALAMLQLRHMGGAMSRVEPGAGARATLPGEFCSLGLGVPFDEASAEAVRESLDAVDRVVAPYRDGEYPNFVEQPSDARGFFDEDTWRRLREVKADRDPEDLFKGNHHIPPA